MNIDINVFKGLSFSGLLHDLGRNRYKMLWSETLISKQMLDKWFINIVYEIALCRFFLFYLSYFYNDQN